jgi:hypothetical protein
MRRILSLARRAFGQSDGATHRLPPLRMITYLPEPVSESRNVRELPPAPTPDQDKSDRDKSDQDKASDDDLELRRICEAIGLDVKDVTGEVTEATHGAAIPMANHDLSHGLRNDDLRNERQRRCP